MISIKQKFIFTHIGRTGGSSIELTLKDVGIKYMHTMKYSSQFSEYQHQNDFIVDMFTDQEQYNAFMDRCATLEFKHSQHWLSIEEQFVVGEDQYDEYFKFTFVRNPWDRLASQYFGHVIQKFPELDFNDFLIKALTEGTFEGDDYRFFAPSMHWITDEESDVMVDYIGRFETLQDDFNIICDKIGLERRILPQYGKSQKDGYKNYYTDQTAELVYDKFKSDIEAFNYEF